MANVILATRQAATDIMTTVSRSTGAVTMGVTALSDLAQVGAINAELYRMQAQASAQEQLNQVEIVGKQRAQLKISRELLEIQRELQADKELAAMFSTVSKEYPKVAAE